MCSGNGTKVCSPVDQFCHPGFGFLVCLLPLGVLQSITDTGFVYIGYIRTEYFILAAQLVHLIAELAVTLLHTVEQSVRDTVLHTVELVLVSGIHQVNISVSLPCQFFLIQFLYIFALTLHFLDFLPLRLFGSHTHRHDTFHIRLGFLETDTESGVEPVPFPVHFRT